MRNSVGSGVVAGHAYRLERGSERGGVDGQLGVVQVALAQVDRRLHAQADTVWYALNKPVGVVTTASDPQGRPTVVELVPSEPRVFPVGRLDADTEGVWTWVSGDPWNFTQWREGEPNNGNVDVGPENCQIIEGDNPALEWDDRDCATLFPYLCERAAPQ